MQRNRRAEKRLNYLFIIVIAIVLVITVGIIALLAYLFNLTELLTIYLDNDLGWFVIMIWIVASITIGLGVSYGFSHIVMKPIRRIIKGMTQLADGEYDVKINLGSKSALTELSDCFNKLSEELKNNEMMRSDFINNFSHELKTPLVSISGLISLMRQPNFPEEKRQEYLQIIEEEANRLAAMTTNILNLSKLETQHIVTDKEKFNLSEQIRDCVLLLEKKWTKKNLDLVIDFDEYKIIGNIDMLKQVWFNIIDNAIKFAYENSSLIINIKEEKNYIAVEVENEGDIISEDEKTKIFNKFYQVENAKQNGGNGIGLSIVKRIVELHDGKIDVQSIDNKTKFTIRLAK